MKTARFLKAGRPLKAFIFPILMVSIILGGFVLSQKDNNLKNAVEAAAGSSLSLAESLDIDVAGPTNTVNEKILRDFVASPSGRPAPYRYAKDDITNPAQVLPAVEFGNSSPNGSAQRNPSIEKLNWYTDIGGGNPNFYRNLLENADAEPYGGNPLKKHYDTWLFGSNDQPSRQLGYYFVSNKPSVDCTNYPRREQFNIAGISELEVLKPGSINQVNYRIGRGMVRNLFSTSGKVVAVVESRVYYDNVCTFRYNATGNSEGGGTCRLDNGQVDASKKEKPINVSFPVTAIAVYNPDAPQGNKWNTVYVGHLLYKSALIPRGNISDLLVWGFNAGGLNPTIRISGDGGGGGGVLTDCSGSTLITRDLNAEWEYNKVFGGIGAKVNFIGITDIFGARSFRTGDIELMSGDSWAISAKRSLSSIEPIVLRENGVSKLFVTLSYNWKPPYVDGKVENSKVSSYILRFDRADKVDSLRSDVVRGTDVSFRYHSYYPARKWPGGSTDYVIGNECFQGDVRANDPGYIRDAWRGIGIYQTNVSYIHDLGWKALSNGTTPFWNDQEAIPYSLCIGPLAQGPDGKIYIKSPALSKVTKNKGSCIDPTFSQKDRNPSVEDFRSAVKKSDYTSSGSGLPGILDRMWGNPPPFSTAYFETWLYGMKGGDQIDRSYEYTQRSNMWFPVNVSNSSIPASAWRVDSSVPSPSTYGSGDYKVCFVQPTNSNGEVRNDRKEITQNLILLYSPAGKNYNLRYDTNLCPVNATNSGYVKFDTDNFVGCYTRSETYRNPSINVFPSHMASSFRNASLNILAVADNTANRFIYIGQEGGVPTFTSGNVQCPVNQLVLRFTIVTNSTNTSVASNSIAIRPRNSSTPQINFNSSQPTLIVNGNYSMEKVSFMNTPGAAGSTDATWIFDLKFEGYGAFFPLFYNSNGGIVADLTITDAAGSSASIPNVGLTGPGMDPLNSCVSPFFKTGKGSFRTQEPEPLTLGARSWNKFYTNMSNGTSFAKLNDHNPNTVGDFSFESLLTNSSCETANVTKVTSHCFTIPNDNVNAANLKQTINDIGTNSSYGMFKTDIDCMDCAHTPDGLPRHHVLVVRGGGYHDYFPKRYGNPSISWSNPFPLSTLNALIQPVTSNRLDINIDKLRGSTYVNLNAYIRIDAQYDEIWIRDDTGNPSEVHPNIGVICSTPNCKMYVESVQSVDKANVRITNKTLTYDSAGALKIRENRTNRVYINNAANVSAYPTSGGGEINLVSKNNETANYFVGHFMTNGFVFLNQTHSSSNGPKYTSLIRGSIVSRGVVLRSENNTNSGLSFRGYPNPFLYVDYDPKMYLSTGALRTRAATNIKYIGI